MFELRVLLCSSMFFNLDSSTVRMIIPQVNSTQLNSTQLNSTQLNSTQPPNHSFNNKGISSFLLTLLFFTQIFARCIAFILSPTLIDFTFTDIQHWFCSICIMNRNRCPIVIGIVFFPRNRYRYVHNMMILVGRLLWFVDILLFSCCFRSSCSSCSFAIDLSAAARTSAVKPTKTSSKRKWPHHRLRLQPRDIYNFNYSTFY